MCVLQLTRSDVSAKSKLGVLATSRQNTEYVYNVYLHCATIIKTIFSKHIEKNRGRKNRKLNFKSGIRNAANPLSWELRSERAFLPFPFELFLVKAIFWQLPLLFTFPLFCHNFSRIICSKIVRSWASTWKKSQQNQCFPWKPRKLKF